MPHVSPRNSANPMRINTPSSSATARFSLELPDPLISENMGGRSTQLAYCSTATGI